MSDHNNVWTLTTRMMMGILSTCFSLFNQLLFKVRYSLFTEQPHPFPNPLPSLPRKGGGNNNSQRYILSIWKSFGVCLCRGSSQKVGNYRLGEISVKKNNNLHQAGSIIGDSAVSSLCQACLLEQRNQKS